MGIRLSLISVMLVLGALTPAYAHGRPAIAYDVVFGPAGPVIVTTFGMVQGGPGDFRWRCTAAMGRVPQEDPAVALSAAGPLAATFRGMQLLEPSGCGMSFVGGGTQRLMIDITQDRSDEYWAVSSDGSDRDNAVFRSPDGENWRRAGVAIEPILFESVLVGDAVHLSGVYPRTAERAEREIVLFRSDDEGESWSRFPFPFVAGERTLYLEAIDDEGRLIARIERELDAFTTPERVLRSADGGATWETLLQVEGAISGVAVRGSTLDVGVRVLGSFDRDGVRVTPSSGLFRSTDGGASFALLEEGRDVQCAVAEGQTLWLCDGPNVLRDAGSGLETYFTLDQLVGPVACADDQLCELEIRDLICDNGLDLTPPSACPLFPDGGVAPDGGSDGSGGGCNVGPSSAAPWGVVLLLLLGGRRRRSLG